MKAQDAQAAQAAIAKAALSAPRSTPDLDTASVNAIRAEMDKARKLIADKVLAGQDFVAESKVLAALDAQREAAQKREDAVKLDSVKDGLKNAIETLVNAVDVGVKISRLYWCAEWVDDKINPPLTHLTHLMINAEPKGKKGNPGVTHTRTSKVTVAVAGVMYQPKAYIAQFGSDTEKAHSYATKWATEQARRIAARLGHGVTES